MAAGPAVARAAGCGPLAQAQAGAAEVRADFLGGSWKPSLARGARQGAPAPIQNLRADLSRHVSRALIPHRES
eukprot:2526581-Pyramimonas_sp.AAC.1